MKQRIMIVIATLFTLIGLVPVAGTFVNLSTPDQLHRLLSYDYMSFADGRVERDLGDFANDFYVGAALMLVGGTLFIRIERTRTVARIVTSLLFALLAFSLVYACLNPRIGRLPL
ncbi:MULTISPECIES: hypothetical protein [Burkholderia]|uniref:DUF998 domain-containing protein n=1 Tax=Burkholderia contaminans TaxID=488447 RepID=A0A2S5DVI0_9BURK|nr:MULTISPECIES: hypothetical protein [Burkholderia]EKS9798891.1 hypothetical protein [Burkholderia cepacia]EKS9805734.1 hypothetical protein [Burkholderia cepacia]EKS9814723.1 hypothetical protein [Burkholderia cepacia]EKS9820129.1 hypothetical protein [Burkholderia cepacia]EKS9828097.1 hypothetical protein [Burkholderia cepacia]